VHWQSGGSISGDRGGPAGKLAGLGAETRSGADKLVAGAVAWICQFDSTAWGRMAITPGSEVTSYPPWATRQPAGQLHRSRILLGHRVRVGFPYQVTFFSSLSLAQQLFYGYQGALERRSFRLRFMRTANACRWAIRPVLW